MHFWEIINRGKNTFKLVGTLLKVPLWPKNQLIFFFGFQNYINKTLSDPRFKPWFQKDTSLF